MTDPVDVEDQDAGPTPLLVPADLKNFATITDAKAQDMIDDAIGTAFIHAPCILDPSFSPDKRKAAKAILRGAILRWNEAGTGAAVTQSSQSYSQTLDTRQTRKVMFFPSELDALKRLCRPDDDDGGAYSIDTLPSETIQHAEICSIYFGGGCSCGAILTQGLPLWEKDNGWA
ncbi:head-to-tail adaptor [Mycobacterium phage FlagStaff]|uniref:Head-to-tail adaptor n=1 Tax=Mycobacterium phage FlagStaff TaxID=1647304 RepID=A0A0F6WE40_9CAUD|nr:head-tail adaptor [Mycobacterium phage FlagStaff]AKF14446.1 head-to-tail adaptor [Mycobacterium phage FlagStaff]